MVKIAVSPHFVNILTVGAKFNCYISDINNSVKKTEMIQITYLFSMLRSKDQAMSSVSRNTQYRVACLPGSYCNGTGQTYPKVHNPQRRSVLLGVTFLFVK